MKTPSLSTGLKLILCCITALTLLSPLASAATPEETIQKTLSAHMPGMPKMDEIQKTPIPGLYEVRIGAELYYVDATGQYLIDGQLIETKTKKNLTQARIDKLTAIAFKDLPLQDAFTIVRGNGARKLAVFEDPNCGYCKRFEADLQKINNVTVYLFLYPILGPDSVEKSKHIWCSPHRAKAWQDWMLFETAPSRKATCNTDALVRNQAFGKKNLITGTPTIFLPNGTRIPGQIKSSELEKMLTTAAATHP